MALKIENSYNYITNHSEKNNLTGHGHPCRIASFVETAWCGVVCGPYAGKLGDSVGVIQ